MPGGDGVVGESVGVLRLRGARFAYPASLRMTRPGMCELVHLLLGELRQDSSRVELPHSSVVAAPYCAAEARLADCALGLIRSAAPFREAMRRS
jgi:hypothetical protein